MRYKRLSAKIDIDKHSDLVQWLDENEINVNQLITHLLYVAMNLGMTNTAPSNSTEKPQNEVRPTQPQDDDDLIASIASFLDGVS